MLHIMVSATKLIPEIPDRISTFTTMKLYFLFKLISLNYLYCHVYTLLLSVAIQYRFKYNLTFYAVAPQ